MEKINVTEEECTEVMNCTCCTHNEDGTHECYGCGSVVKPCLDEVEE